MTDTRKKLIKLLYEAPCESEHEGKPGSCQYRKFGRCGEVDRLDHCAVVHLADHLIANGVTVQEWIPVTERLPEYEEPVMGWDAELRDMGIVNFVYGQFFDIIDMSKVNVTHWMPLPEPPKGE